MYSGPIIDAHHHLWDYGMRKHPWLQPKEGAVQALGSLERLRRNFLPDDFAEASAAFDVEATVHIEALWAAGDPTGETQWLEALPRRGGIAARYVAAARLEAEDAAVVIARQAAFARVAGVRSILSHHPGDAVKSFCARGDLADDPAWRQGVAALEAHGLHLELMIYPYQARAVERLARDRPGLPIIINHCGSPIDRDGEGMRRWREGLARLAQYPNIALKVSDPGAYDPQWTDDSILEVIGRSIEAFGPTRIMFASDHPVSLLYMPLEDTWRLFRTAAAGFSGAGQRAMFHDNAARLYRM